MHSFDRIAGLLSRLALPALTLPALTGLGSTLTAPAARAAMDIEIDSRRPDPPRRAPDTSPFFDTLHGWIEAFDPTHPFAIIGMVFLGTLLAIWLVSKAG